MYECLIYLCVCFICIAILSDSISLIICHLLRRSGDHRRRIVCGMMRLEEAILSSRGADKQF